MAKKTIVFAFLLIALGLAVYMGTGHHMSSLIPTWFGAALCVGGILARSKSESRRKLFMQLNLTTGLVGLLYAVAEFSRSLIGLFQPLSMVSKLSNTGNGGQETISFSLGFVIELTSRAVLTVLFLTFSILCMRWLIAARRYSKI